jgi:hypothetical protein
MKTKKISVPVFEADSHVLEAGDMRPEYDFSKGVRDKHYKDLSKGYTSVVNHPDGTKEITHYRPIPDMIHLAPDVRRYFPDSDAVNAALRGLIALIPAKRRAAQGPAAGQRARGPIKG